MAKKINIQKDVESRRRISQKAVPTTVKEKRIQEPIKETENAQSKTETGPQTDETATPLSLQKKGGRKTHGDA